MKTSYLLIFALISSCAWNRKQLVEVRNDKDMVDSFELKDARFQKFKEQKIQEAAPVPDPENIEAPEKTLENELAQAGESEDAPKTVVKKEAPKKVVKKLKPKVKVKLASKKQKKRAVNKIIQRRKYPKDYPEEMKVYEKEAKKLWKEFKPNFKVGERFILDVSYLGITAGKVYMRVMPMTKIGNNLSYHFYARIQSAPMFKLIYTLDDYIDSYLDEKTFLPLKFSMVQRESAQKVDSLELFDSDDLKTYFVYKRVKHGKEKNIKLDAFIPKLFHDSFSGLYFMRGLKLEVGKHYEFPVVTRGKLWVVKADIEKKEMIDIQGEEVEAFRIKAVTQFPGVLKKKGDILFWYATSPDHRFLKFEAKVKIGSLSGELVEYSAP